MGRGAPNWDGRAGHLHKRTEKSTEKNENEEGLSCQVGQKIRGKTTGKDEKNGGGKRGKKAVHSHLGGCTVYAKKGKKVGKKVKNIFKVGKRKVGKQKLSTSPETPKTDFLKEKNKTWREMGGKQKEMCWNLRSWEKRGVLRTKKTGGARIEPRARKRTK